MNQLDLASTYKEKINAHQDLAYYFSRSDSSKVMYHIDAMIELAKGENDDFGYYQAYTSLASFKTKSSDYRSAGIALSNAYAMALKMKNPQRTSAILGNIGVLKYYQNDLDSALYYLDTSYQIKRTLPEVDSSNLSRNLHSLAVISSNLDQFEEAIRYQTEALKIAENQGNNSTYLRALSGLASLYDKLNEKVKAHQYDVRVYQMAKKLGDAESVGVAARNIGMNYLHRESLDSANIYFQEAIVHFEKIGYQRGLAEVNISKGDLYMKESKMARAISAYLRAIDNGSIINDDKVLAGAHINLGLCYLQEGRFNKAEASLLIAYDLYENINSSEGLKESSIALSRFYEKLNKWEQAISYYKRYEIQKDSINQQKLKKEVKEIQLEYETELKDAEIAKQKAIIGKQQTSRKYLITISGLLLLLSSFIGGFIWLRSKKNKLLYQQNSMIQKQRIEQLEQEKKILGMNAMIEGQEAERTRIAKDLHDGLGGLLSTVKAHFSNIQNEIQQIESLQIYDRAQKMMDEACDEVRRISHNLMPGVLRLEGLQSAVEVFAKEISDAHDIKINVEGVNLNNRMLESQEVFVYRIIQEALNNIIKHAAASEVLIQMSETEAEYHFIIEDDGRGFDPLQIQSGLGLKSIHSRVDYLKGALDIDTRVEVGTTISFHIPKA